MAKDRLLSGSLILSAGPGLGASSLGLVSGETSTAGAGAVQITLAAEHCEVTFANGVSIRVAEHHARQLGTAMQDTCIRLEHLRALYKLRRLDASAVMDAPIEQRGTRDDAATANKTAITLVELPHPAEPPAFTWADDAAVVSYPGVDGQIIRLTFEGTLSVRRLAASSNQPAAVLRIDGDPWLSKNTDADPRDGDFEHFAAVFELCVFEIVAKKFSVHTATVGT